jgi:dihydrofolate reductase
MTIALLVAVAENNVIGKQGTLLPWRLSADLKHFRRLTLGHAIVMGRKTYETIGRALPGRLNIVVTRNAAFTAPGCTIAHSLDDALAAARTTGKDEVFIIGGGELFEASMDRAQKLYLTLVHARPDGDTFFTYDPAAWREIERETHSADDKNQYDYSFVTLVRA